MPCARAHSGSPLLTCSPVTQATSVTAMQGISETIPPSYWATGQFKCKSGTCTCKARSIGRNKGWCACRCQWRRPGRRFNPSRTANLRPGMQILDPGREQSWKKRSGYDLRTDRRESQSRCDQLKLGPEETAHTLLPSPSLAVIPRVLAPDPDPVPLLKLHRCGDISAALRAARP
jgi:hypothetical protein